LTRAMAEGKTAKCEECPRAKNLQLLPSSFPDPSIFLEDLFGGAAAAAAGAMAAAAAAAAVAGVGVVGDPADDLGVFLSLALDEDW